MAVIDDVAGKCTYDIVIFTRFAEPWLDKAPIPFLIENALQAVEDNLKVNFTYHEVKPESLVVSVDAPANVAPKLIITRLKKAVSPSIIEQASGIIPKNTQSKELFSGKSIINTVGNVIRDKDIAEFIETSIESRYQAGTRYRENKKHQKQNQ